MKLFKESYILKTAENEIVHLFPTFKCQVIYEENTILQKTREQKCFQNERLFIVSNIERVNKRKTMD